MEARQVRLPPPVRRLQGFIADIVGGSVGLPDPLMSIVSDEIFATAPAAIGLRVLVTPDPQWNADEQIVTTRAAAGAPARA